MVHPADNDSVLQTRQRNTMAAPRTTIRQIVLTLLTAAACLAPACLNDRDTLADEASRNRDLLTTLVGGFERNPPLYYEMRIQRIQAELKANPKLLDEYDDIAVACDRIGNDDEALRWIEAKKKQLPPLDKGNAENSDQWYRYYANAGTFHAHRWVHRGAPANDLQEIALGRDLIQKAIWIKPDAHFGREKYQLVVMKWLIFCRKEGGVPLATFIADPGFRLANGLPGSEGGISFQTRKEAATGLAGLIRLGGAWQSVDVYLALAGLMQNYRNNPLQSVAILRAKELLAAGKKSLNPDFKSIDGELYHVYTQNALNESEMGEYRRLRKLADDWNAKREAFMLTKLRASHHPDTDPNFWYGAPAMPSFTVHQSLWTYLTAKVFTPMNLMLLICPGLPVLLFLWVSIRIARGLTERRTRLTPNA